MQLGGFYVRLSRPLPIRAVLVVLGTYWSARWLCWLTEADVSSTADDLRTNYGTNLSGSSSLSTASVI